MSRIRKHLTYANVISTLTLFLVLGGGTALAAYVVSSNSQIGPGTVSGHKPPTGKHANIIAGSINGKDIADRSGVDTCSPGLQRLGRVCARSDGVDRGWFSALDYCGALGLRLPTPGEAVTVAKSFDVPGVDSSGVFWTDNEFFVNGGFNAVVVSEDGVLDNASEGQSNETVCVAIPSV
jgi:hypothetical protein